MTPETFRYSFARRLPLAEIESIILMAWFATEGLFGEARTRLEATHLLDRKRCICLIRARGPAGQAANRIFVALVGRVFGPDSFVVERPVSGTAGENPNSDRVVA